MSNKGIVGSVKSYMIKGLVITVPSLVTIFILSFAFGFVSNAVSPLTDLIESIIGTTLPPSAVSFVSICVLLLIILIIGALVDMLPTAKRVTDIFHAIVESLPGIGSVYSSFRKMSETMMQGGNSFRDVKLAEYPSEGCYTIAFVTAGKNPIVEEAVGVETTTLFIPMAPNPFMGGFVVNLPDDRVHEVDMKVRDGIKAVITSGITMTADEDDETIQIDAQLDNQLDDFQNMIDVGDEDDQQSADEESDGQSSN